MNMLLKLKLKSIAEETRAVDFEYELTNEKITLQEKYIEEVKQNKDKCLKREQMLTFI